MANIKVVLKPKQGIKVDSSNKYLYDPTLIQKYVDASREYSEEAKLSEANAKASEMNAELSAEQAKISENNAKLSETNAKTSETNAKNSEVKAKKEADASAESAYQSQQSALASYEYASNADEDAKNALETLGHVLESEAKITQSEQNTLKSEQNAKQSELNAKASETKATQEATSSAESAYQSQQSALASHEYASNAEADAQNVNESLDKVLESLDKVLISESNAKASEGIALDSANVAKTKSQEALQSANIATEKADESSQFALECQAIKNSLGSVYVFKGSVNTASELPNNAQVGDVYDVKDTGINYAWTGTEWDALGVTVDFDLSEYATKEYVDTTEQEIIENYMDADTSLQTQITGLSTVVDEEQDKLIAIEGKIPTSASASNLLSTANDLLNAVQDVRADFAEADSELQTQINGQATAIAEKQDKLTAGENITINGNVISATSELNSKITNCITEIPQDIKLELNDGTITLKAGSKVYVPNGAGKFDEVNITTDRTPASNTLTGKYFIFATGSILIIDATNIKSGSTFPSSATSGNKFYNTTENKFYRYSGTEWQPNGYSLPLAIVTLSSGSVTSIDQVFNGFGYIGKRNYILPGVKLLISKGYNEDGSYKNQEYIVNNVIISRNDFGVDSIMFFRSNRGYQVYNIYKPNYLGELSSTPAVGTGFQWYYNTTERLWYMHEMGETSWNQIDYANVGEGTETNTKFKGVFRAVDYNDLTTTLVPLSATSGTVSLAVNKIYTIAVSGATTFALPATADKTVFNQIKVMMKVTGTPTINWGTTKFFNKSTPEIEEGSYDIYFDYDNLLGAWVCGVMAKGAGE